MSSKLSLILLTALGLTASLIVGPASTARAQEFGGPGSDADVQIEPDSLSLTVGDRQRLTVRVDGREINGPRDSVFYFSRSPEAVSVDSTGQVEAHAAGTFELFVLVPDSSRGPARRSVPVRIRPAPIAELHFRHPPSTFFVGSTYRLRLRAVDTQGKTRTEAPVAFSSTDPSVARIDSAGYLHVQSSGEARVRATAESVETRLDVRARENPVRRIELSVDETDVRTGDVVRLQARALDADGEVVEQAPIRYHFDGHPDDSLGSGAPAQIADDGRFVAQEPGRYTLLARSGSIVAEEHVHVRPRNVDGEIEVLGRGVVRDKHTSDLWVWEGLDGRDYAVTGTWGAEGEAYFWDVTNPRNIRAIDTVQVDARTVNDVKVAENGRVAVITREGASDRKNGIVILDVTDPTDVEILARHTDQLTGGVHNAFIHADHVYAVSNARRIEIVDISDPRAPETVGQFELETPGHSVHDVWIENGIAYTSNWQDGVVAIDVGNGIAGGSPANPVEISRYAYPKPWAHAAFPYEDEKTGRFYVVVGDEAFPNGLHVVGQPTIPAGWLHFVDFTDWDRPDEVARYKIPEAGTHNFWIRNDTLYVAYYNAGLRVVDLSGELMGNLYEQGREIAKFVPRDPKSIVPNAAMSWGPQPHKGTIFLSDWNSGLWAVRLVSSSPMASTE